MDGEQKIKKVLGVFNGLFETYTRHSGVEGAIVFFYFFNAGLLKKRSENPAIQGCQTIFGKFSGFLDN